MQFSTIFLDPPWPYDQTHVQGAAARAYTLMTWDAIADIGPLIHAVAAPDCAIFMWVTAPLLMETARIVTSWRMRYITKAFTWVKTYPDGGLYVGLGRHTRANTEDVWLLSNGAPKRCVADVSQVVMARVAAHSRKPDEHYRRAARLYPGPYLELFARRPRTGWVTLGNEIDGLDIRDSLHALAGADAPPIIPRPAIFNVALDFGEAA